MVSELNFAEVLDGIPVAVRPGLAEVLNSDDFSGVISAAQTNRLVASGLSHIDELMLHLLPAAERYSTPPISDFHVGSVVLGASGNLYFGTNMEFEGLPLNFSVHGEQAAIVNARSHQETGVQALAIGGLPCGHCRQFMIELGSPKSVEIIVPDGCHSLLEALPEPFTPDSLGNSMGLLSSQHHSLGSAEIAGDAVEQGALDAANLSYAPYSQSYSGVALRLSSGAIISGSYVESVAFNPSLSPLHVALIQLNLSRHRCERIERAVLVEVPGAQISQRSTTAVLLGSVGDITLDTIYAQPSDSSDDLPATGQRTTCRR